MFDPLKVARVIDTTVPAVDKNGNISKLINSINIITFFFQLRRYWKLSRNVRPNTSLILNR
jgi:hypothetical protein